MAVKPPKPAPKKEDSKKAEPKKKSFEKKLMKGAGIGFGLMLIFVIWAAFQPRQGSLQFGICRTFVELIEPYPQELKVLGAEDYVNDYGENRVIMFYRSTDTFGEKKSNTISCIFDTDEQGNILPTIKSVDINRKRTYEAESPEHIKRFNKGIPALLENSLNVEIPYFDLDDITTYRDIE